MKIQCYHKDSVLNAIQYLSYNADEVIAFTGGKAQKQPVYSSLLIDDGKIGVGDFVVKEDGNFIVLHPHKFESKYQQIKL